MTYTATVTQKGQVTIPKKVRDLLNIKQYDSVSITIVDDIFIKILPSNDLVSMAGSFIPPKNKHKTALQARDAIEKSYSPA